MNTDKNILLLAYKFPPYEGVGARRWAKFTKYFSEKDVKIHVISNAWKKGSGRSWIKDIADKSNIIVNPFQTLFEKLDFSVAFLNKLVFKIRYKLADYFVWTDEASYFYNYNRKRIIDYIIKNNINVIIATGGPFSTNYFGATLKRKFPQIKLIQDFRDLWTEEYFYEFPLRTESGKFYKKEIECEKVGLEFCDYIVSVTPGYIERIKRKVDSFGFANKKYVLIENGFDPAEVKEFKIEDYPAEIFEKEKFNISHFGTAGFGREEEFHKFLVSVKDLIVISKYPILFHFFGHFGDKYKTFILQSDLAASVRFYEFLPPEKVQLFMFFSDMHLVINDAVWHYAYGSKVYDAFMYAKPVLLISKEEGLYSLISENKIGLATNNTELQNKRVVETILENVELIRSKKYFNNRYNYDNHSILKLTDKYLEIINE